MVKTAATFPESLKKDEVTGIVSAEAAIVGGCDAAAVEDG